MYNALYYLIKPLGGKNNKSFYKRNGIAADYKSEVLHIKYV